MKIALDTSVIVAALVAAHPEHERARHQLHGASRTHTFMTWHAIAETWSVLTRFPVRPSISPDAAHRALTALQTKVRCLDLTAKLYAAALERCAAKGLRSGAIFDALHLVAAERIGADRFYTFNIADFARLSITGSPRIGEPE